MIEYKPIPNYENYTIGQDGTLINTRFNRIVKPILTKQGYHAVELWKNNERKQIFIHQLVAQAFVSKIEGKNIVNHIDGNRRNNHYSNLEWVTVQENNKHGFYRRNGKNISKMAIMKMYKRKQYKSVEDFLIDLMSF